MHPIEAFVRHPVKVSVGVILVALFGVLAIFRMPMQLTPEVERPTISVRTNWPGRSPQEIEKEIIQKQEGIKRLADSLKKQGLSQRLVTDFIITRMSWNRILSQKYNPRPPSQEQIDAKFRQLQREIKNFTGIDDPYEEPEEAEVVIDTELLSPDEAAQKIILKLEAMGLIAVRTGA